MTEDIWEELELKYHLQVYDDSSVIIKYDVLIGLIGKGEKYDEIQDCVPLVRHMAFEQVVKEYKTMQDKLEAIKNWYDRFIDNKTIFDSDEAITIFMSEFKELDKIMEAEG